MRLSCRARYATRALITLALHHGDDPVPLISIAESEGISKKYLNQLMGPLKVAGLVRVARGKHGGFMLARPPAQITLGDVLHAVEGDMSLVDCVLEASVCSKAPQCLSRPAWVGLSRLINDYLENTTLEDIVGKNPQMGLSVPRLDRQAERR